MVYELQRVENRIEKLEGRSEEWLKSAQKDTKMGNCKNLQELAGRMRKSQFNRKMQRIKKMKERQYLKLRISPNQQNIRALIWKNISFLCMINEDVSLPYSEILEYQ